MNYIMQGFQALKDGFLLGILIYLIIAVILYLSKIRRSISLKCIFEIIFCIYGVTLLKLTGIFTLNFHLNGIFSYNVIPFIGSSIVPVLLNFILFVPCGLLLPLVFRSCEWNWKKIVMIGGLTSLVIELLQMFGGRYAEIDDLLFNTLGAFSGYIVYFCIQAFKENRKKAVLSFLSLCLALLICFAGVYFIGNNEEQLPDGLYAAQDHIAEVHVYFNGEKQTVTMPSEIYNCFVIQMSNCGGHLFETENVSENTIWNDDCFIEIIYDSPQNIRFENADGFMLQNADRLLYNANENVLYWGNSDYQNCVDYTALDEELQAHREEILKQYEQLSALIENCFQS